ncbi:MAG: ribosome small subunit-dependent GTPase A [Ignavibacteria bacterium]|nr:ribosome small subunit-dependent GTPase A [Ignavibacteria bacterium]
MTNFTNLVPIGWNEFFEDQMNGLEENLIPGRVIISNKNNYLISIGEREITGEVSGKFHFNAESKDEFPAVGDWVLMRKFDDYDNAIIESVMKRKSKLSRNSAGLKLEEQILASNIDIVFIISSLNQDINLRRLERYVSLIIDNKLTPVMILSKADLSENTEEKLEDVKKISGNYDIHVISALKNTGMDELRKYFTGNQTVAVIGSSGVGKSTIINNLCGESVMEVSDISLYKDKGRHTTSHRELIFLKDGGSIIDTPGMRELQLWEGNEGLSEAFPDIEKYLGQCRFSNCEHDTEPGCAIKDAIERGEFDSKRFQSYKKLEREITRFENKSNKKAMLKEKKKWKKMSFQIRKSQHKK